MKKSVIVTGATGYFGRYFVNALKTDYHIIATSRSHKKLAESFNESEVEFLITDLYEPNVLKESFAKIAKTSQIVGLINNAFDFSKKTGFNTPEGRIESISIDQLRAGLDSGLLAQIVACQAIGAAMIAQRISGSIINISSMYGSVSPDAKLYHQKQILNPVTYSICKAGMNALTRYLASFWGEHGIRCNSIAPGAFPNIETDGVNAPKDYEFISRLTARTTLGRVGHPTDLIGAVKFLLSEESRYITGQVIGVDGGWTVT